ncbi:hypothetical protein P43SY_007623 [Pythium insidiosum]|uniref:EF-hand domain-containing protein n=1 Tax=Pythium insidiosum TaxID=114742 RepID=A0AAD5M340_PYTIN|nr:hypothetical protein P43SY_007623 [Pythium insidiosum]
MLQQLHENVFLLVQPATARARDARSRPKTLQYVLSNVGQQSVSVRADWSASEHVAVNGHTSQMVVETVVHPLQRRELARVQRLSESAKRGFVRVTCAVRVLGGEERCTRQEKEVNDASLDGDCGDSQRVLKALAPALESHRCVSVTAASITRRTLDEIDGVGVKLRVVDPTFPPTDRSLVGHGAEPAAATWTRLNDALDSSWVFQRSRLQRQETQAPTDVVWSCGLAGQESLLCALAAMHDTAAKSHMLSQWSVINNSLCSRESGETFAEVFRGRSAVAVPLWPQGTFRRDILIDLCTPTVSHGQGQLSIWSSAGEAYTLLLHKALAKLHGNYAALAVIPTRRILLEITGLAIDDIFPASNDHDASRDAPRLMHELRHIGRCLPMASFGRVDGHHCAFRVLAATTDHIELLDPSRVLLYGVKSLGHLQHVQTAEESSSLLIPWDPFFSMDPCVFAVQTRQHEQLRRRRLVHSAAHSISGAFTWRLALSVPTSTSISLLATCCSLSDYAEDADNELTVSVSRVDDHDLTQRLLWATSTCRRLRFTAPSGEYIISLKIAKTQKTERSEQPEERCTPQRSLRETIDMLFACLDNDANGLLGRRELRQFLRCGEPEEGPDDDAIDDFLHIFASVNPNDMESPLALTRDDLLLVYQKMAVDGRLHDVIDMVQRDLERVLPACEDAHGVLEESLLDIVCVVSSDTNGCRLVPIE